MISNLPVTDVNDADLTDTGSIHVRGLYVNGIEGKNFELSSSIFHIFSCTPEDTHTMPASFNCSAFPL